MTPKKSKANKQVCLHQMGFPCIRRILPAVLILGFVPVVLPADDHMRFLTATLRSETPLSDQKDAPILPGIHHLGCDHTFLMVRAAFSSSGRPSRLRVGGIGGGFHGAMTSAATFEPEIPGQSIQQSIGQTLGQTPKPAPSSQPKTRGKPHQKKTTPSAGTPATSAKVQKASQKKPTVYVIEMNDGQLYQGTMKPTDDDGYIVTTKRGTLTLKNKDIRQLKKAEP